MSKGSFGLRANHQRQRQEINNIRRVLSDCKVGVVAQKIKITICYLISTRRVQSEKKGPENDVHQTRYGQNIYYDLIESLQSSCRTLPVYYESIYADAPCTATSWRRMHICRLLK
jgi:hypothetical protein